MKFTKPFLLISLTLALTSLTTIGAVLAEHANHDDARQLRLQGEIIALETLLQKSEFAPPIRILEAELEQEWQHWIYEIQVLDAAGQVWEWHYDAITGKRLKSEREH